MVKTVRMEAIRLLALVALRLLPEEAEEALVSPIVHQLGSWVRMVHLEEEVLLGMDYPYLVLAATGLSDRGMMEGLAALAVHIHISGNGAVAAVALEREAVMRGMLRMMIAVLAMEAQAWRPTSLVQV